MLKGKQLAVIGLVVVLMGLLFSLDIKGLVKEEGQHSGEAAENATQTSLVTLQTVSEAAKQTLSANLSRQINDLEIQLKDAKGAEALELQRQLVQKWDDVNQPAAGGFYQELIAQQTNTLADWLKTGDFFTEAYQNIQDSVAQPALVQKAIVAYQKATELDPKSLDAKTGLGVAYVSGTPNPMQGIQLLLAVVKEDPKNIKANMNLGLFSMRSGQFQKAVDRLKTVLEQEQKPESWFYLATAYENLGQKQEAIAAYLKSKELAADPQITQFVDHKVEELSK
ncbi:tetratricopeptide repeat protein [Pedobacter sp. SYSU D00535]|uniref:tetratricopeptide repeat protein n=1 Tax=Pedobacter sp. SYSU D00535 TaxID=2810308 RepID=UPI001A97C72C|nr:tetratricopeptide repeat protein [Pedobacter sp. SYSU D00535]